MHAAEAPEVLADKLELDTRETAEELVGGESCADRL